MKISKIKLKGVKIHGTLMYQCKGIDVLIEIAVKMFHLKEIAVLMAIFVVQLVNCLNGYHEKSI